jgi:hypothetical protein
VTSAQLPGFDGIGPWLGPSGMAQGLHIQIRSAVPSAPWQVNSVPRSAGGSIVRLHDTHTLAMPQSYCDGFTLCTGCVGPANAYMKPPVTGFRSTYSSSDWAVAVKRYTIGFADGSFGFGNGSFTS